MLLNIFFVGYVVQIISELEKQSMNSKDSPEKPMNNKLGSFITYVMLHIILHLSAIVPVYAILTINIQLISFLALITLLQLRLTKNNKFANYISKNMHPSRAFKTFTLIDDDNKGNSQQETSQKCVYGFHPHGIYALGFFCSFNIDSDPYFCSIKGLVSNFILNLPVFGGILRLWGFGSVSSHQMMRCMQKGRSIALLPGGFEEATITSPDEFRCWIKHRKGFIKYALKYNYAIRPVLVFQEHQGFWTFKPLLSLRLFLNKLKIPGVLFWNKFSGLILPTNLDITVVKGRDVNQDKSIGVFDPSHELVQQTHKQYMLQIERLYHKYQILNRSVPLALF